MLAKTYMAAGNTALGYTTVGRTSLHALTTTGASCAEQPARCRLLLISQKSVFRKRSLMIWCQGDSGRISTTSYKLHSVWRHILTHGVASITWTTASIDATLRRAGLSCSPGRAIFLGDNTSRPRSSALIQSDTAFMQISLRPLTQPAKTLPLGIVFRLPFPTTD